MYTHTHTLYSFYSHYPKQLGIQVINSDLKGISRWVGCNSSSISNLLSVISPSQRLNRGNLLMMEFELMTSQLVGTCQWTTPGAINIYKISCSVSHHSFNSWKDFSEIKALKKFLLFRQHNNPFTIFQLWMCNTFRIQVCECFWHTIMCVCMYVCSCQRERLSVMYVHLMEVSGELYTQCSCVYVCTNVNISMNNVKGDLIDPSFWED